MVNTVVKDIDTKLIPNDHENYIVFNSLKGAYHDIACFLVLIERTREARASRMMMCA